MYMTMLKRTTRSIYFIALAWHTMLILWKKGFHEFVFTILPRSLFNTLTDLPCSAFVSKLFISNDSLILRSCMLDNFANIFGCSQLNGPWHSLECSVAPNASHLPAMLSSWCSTDRASTRFFVSPIYSPHNHNLIRKHWSNCLAIVYFYYYIVCFSVL